MKDQEIIQKDDKEIKKKKMIRIIILISSIVVIAVVITVAVVFTRQKDEDGKSKENNEENISDTIINSNTDEQISEYDQTCLFLQLLNFGGKEANSFSPRAEPKSELRSDGVYYRTEINFGTKYPNSYLDIYYPGDVKEDRPTYIYWHGGGHIFGDKNLGDPLSPNSDTSMHMFDYICKQGFNFISVNYCFAPAYRYPAQILQYDQVLDYLNKHSAELNLNMNKVILAGSSGGAIYTTQWTMLLTSDVYLQDFNKVLEEKGLEKISKVSLNRNQVKALVLEGTPMIINGMNEGTQVLFRCWYGEGDIINLWYSKLTHIVEYVNSNFIPSFITAGNTDCFPEDALELKNKLEELNVDYSYCYWDKDVEELKHGYMSSFETSVHAKMALDQCLDFVKSKVN